jgi:membrane protease YdiL (CAAX protease family)
VLVGCSGTAAAGALFSWLRLRSGSLLAPALLHLTANSGGLLASVAAARRDARAGASSGQHLPSPPW